MFTGIIETLGKVSDITLDGANLEFTIESTISEELKIDQSVSHNGVCLTVTYQSGNKHRVTAIHETLAKSNLSKLKVGMLVNLERSMLSNGRFDGHIVQGHVDQVGTCLSGKDENGSWLFDFEYDASLENVTIEKGSIAIDGISLTCFNSRPGGFTVAIIPFTMEHTNFGSLQPGSLVNLEFDVVGKYVRRLLGRD